MKCQVTLGVALEKKSLDPVQLDEPTSYGAVANDEQKLDIESNELSGAVSEDYTAPPPRNNSMSAPKRDAGASQDGIAMRPGYKPI